MNGRLFFIGVLLWGLCVAALRQVPVVLRPHGLGTTACFYTAGFLATGGAVWALSDVLKISRERSCWAAILLLLPTLLLDAIATRYFEFFFPDANSSYAANFGAWMMWCAAGALYFNLRRGTKGVDVIAPSNISSRPVRRQSTLQHDGKDLTTPGAQPT